MFVCVCLGVVYFVVFGGFVVNEFVVWIDDVKLVVIVIVLCGIEGNKVLLYKFFVDEVILLVEYKL